MADKIEASGEGFKAYYFERVETPKPGWQLIRRETYGHVPEEVIGVFYDNFYHKPPKSLKSVPMQAAVMLEWLEHHSDI